jgi:hypothetical protein
VRDIKAFEDRMIVIDPGADNPIGLNPLDIPVANTDYAIDQLQYLFASLLETKMTANQTVLFRNVFRLLIRVPKATLETSAICCLMDTNRTQSTSTSFLRKLKISFTKSSIPSRLRIGAPKS